MYPKLVINLEKLNHNIRFLINKMKKHQLSMTAITKLYGADAQVISVLESYPEIDYFGDSRIGNLMKLQASSKKKILIRLPMHSEIHHVIKYVDISFNSEIATIRLLNEEAKRQDKKHQILIMIDLGDLREGFFKEDDWMVAIAEVTAMSHIELVGLGVNLMCYGGVIPDEVNLGKLVTYAQRVAKAFDLELKMISGGNSSALYLLDDDDATLPTGITNLRIGDAFFTGETSLGIKFPEMHGDVFTLEAEITSLKVKKERLKGTLALSRQSIDFDSFYPFDERLVMTDASSDELVLDFTACKGAYSVGDIVIFRLHYGAVLQAFTSKYVTKAYVEMRV